MFLMSPMILLPLFSIGALLAIIVIILVLTRNLKLERLDYHPFMLPPGKEPTSILEEIANKIEKYGYLVERKGNEVIVSLDSIIHVHLRVASASSPTLEYYVSIESWFTIVMIILLIFAFWIAVIIGIIEYFRYDSLKKLIISIIHTSTAK